MLQWSRRYYLFLKTNPKISGKTTEAPPRRASFLPLPLRQYPRDRDYLRHFFPCRRPIVGLLWFSPVFLIYCGLVEKNPTIPPGLRILGPVAKTPSVWGGVYTNPQPFVPLFGPPPFLALDVWIISDMISVRLWDHLYIIRCPAYEI